MSRASNLTDNLKSELNRYYNDILPEDLYEAGGAGVEVEGEGGSATSRKF